MATESAPAPESARAIGRREAKVVAVLAAVQFVNAFDFLMVMPLGPDFSRALGFDVSRLGWVGGAYMAAASISGLALSSVLDRFDRRTALLICLFGLAAATCAGGWMSGFWGLIFARAAAGAFAGPATALTFSMAADLTRPERRGRAMGAVMSAFSIASVFGVPAGLELARRGGWRVPFFVIGAVGFLVWAIAYAAFPAVRDHIELARREPPWKATARLLRRRPVLYAFAALSFGMCASFLVIPNLATFLEFNLGFPRASLGALYLKSGLITLVFVLLSGRMIDRWGSTAVSSLATVALGFAMISGMVVQPPAVSTRVFFVVFMVALSVRSVSGTALASQVPAAHERARFTSLLSVIQNAMSALGAMASSLILSENADGSLRGMPIVAAASLFVALFVVLFIALLERLSLGSGSARASPGSGTG